MKNDFYEKEETERKSIEKKRKESRDQELADIKSIIETEHGLRFFRRLLAEGSVFSTTFRGNSQSFFLEGHRNLALKFLNDIQVAAPHRIEKLMVIKEEENNGH